MHQDDRLVDVAAGQVRHRVDDSKGLLAVAHGLLVSLGLEQVERHIVGDNGIVHALRAKSTAVDAQSLLAHGGGRVGKLLAREATGYLHEREGMKRIVVAWVEAGDELLARPYRVDILLAGKLLVGHAVETQHVDG